MASKRNVDSPAAEAELVLRQFMMAMIDNDTYPVPEDSIRENARDKHLLGQLQKIQDKYCVDSKWRRYGVISSWPSEYNVMITKAELKSDTKIHFHVERKTGGVNFKTLIEMLLVEGAWKVHRRWSVKAGNKLVADQL